MRKDLRNNLFSYTRPEISRGLASHTMLKDILVLLLVVSSLTPREALVEGSAGLRFSGKNGTSYAEYDPWNWRPNATLQFYFQTSSLKKALVFYQDDRGTRKNQFMDLFLLNGNGHAQFRARVGHDEKKVRVIEHNFADSKWHKVKVELSEKEIMFSIEDDSNKVHRTAPIGFSKNAASHTNDPLFIAGIPIMVEWSNPKLFEEVFITRTLSPSLFDGCIGDIRIYRSTSGRLERARLRQSANAEDSCSGACARRRCFNGGRCIDKIWESVCDCTGTGYEGDSCRKPSIVFRMNVPDKIGGYILQRLSDDSPILSTERNTIDFMFLTESKDGVIFYMGRDKDHLLVELVNGSLRIEADFGGERPVVVQSGNNALSDSCWHYVEIRRRKTRLTVIIDKEKTGKDSQNSSTSYQMLNLNNHSNVIYYGGGPPEVLVFAQANPLSFRGYLKQFRFEEFNVLDNAFYIRDGFSVKSDSFQVGRANSHNFLLQSAEGKCRVEGSGCSPSDDDSDSCKPSTIATEGTTKSTTASTTTLKRIPPQPQTQPPVMEKQQTPTPRPKGVSAWVIILIVLAAMALVLISVFLLYRWNHRYTGSFKPSKNEEGQPQEPGVEAEQQQSTRAYNQPAFFVYKPPKKSTTAQSPPVSI